MDIKKCNVDGCDRKHAALGLCQTHRKAQKRGIDPHGYQIRVPEQRVCRVPACEEPHYTLDYCRRHYYLQYRGLPMDYVRPEPKWAHNAYGYLVRSKRTNGVNRVTSQHRVIMAEIIGRPLTEEETVHHLNGIRDDNRPENLELWSKSQPNGQRVFDKIAWAKEIISTYGTDEEKYKL